MRTIQEHLSSYASYHRDRRNIATHYVGIPMIVLGIFAFLGRPALALSGVTPALAVLVLGIAFYLRLDLRFGLAMLAVNLPAFLIGGWVAAQSTSHWLAGASGLFVAGWVIQFIGHAFEGKKPAFVDDLVGLLIGPLFLVAETAFAVGLRPELGAAIEAVAGPTHGARRESAARATV